jgi:hypothetical protein
MVRGRMTIRSRGKKARQNPQQALPKLQPPEEGIMTKCPLPNSVIRRCTLWHGIRGRDTGKYMFLVPLFDLAFLNGLAARGAGISNRRH